MNLPRSDAVGSDWPLHQTERTSNAGGPPWVAADESGATGENLVDDKQRVVTHATIRIDDAEAAVILDELRAIVGATQSREVKFAQFSKKKGLEALAKTVGSDGALHDRVNIVAGDKRFMAASKIIDLLIEEWAHEHDIDLYNDGSARRMARTFFADGPRALGARWEPLIGAFVSLARATQRNSKKEDVESFFRKLEDARWHCTRRNVETVLTTLLETRNHAEGLVQDAKDGPSRAISALDPLAALIPLSIQLWHQKIGTPARFLHDDVKLLTPSFVQTMLYSMWHLHPDFRRLVKPVRVATFCVGNSIEHPSIQLADLFASAGRIVVEAHLGHPSDAATILGDPVMRIVTFGVLPDDTFWAESDR